MAISSKKTSGPGQRMGWSADFTQRAARVYEVNGGGVPMQVRTIGIDLGKTVFHLVGLNQRGEVVVRKKFCGICGRSRPQQFSSSWRFDSYPLVPGCHTFLILHGIAETFGLDAEVA